MSKKSIITRALIAFVLWLLVVTAALSVYFWQWLSTSYDIAPESRQVVIKNGQSFYSLAYQLEKQGLLQWPRVWIYYARLNDTAFVNAGEFQLAKQESPLSLLRRLQSNEVIQYTVTFVEGSRAADALDTLRQQNKLKHVLPTDISITNPEIDAIEVEHLEGWIFPDTYSYSAGDTDHSILVRAYKRTLKVLEEEWQGRAQGLPYKNSYEALIMASIIEKETGAPHERDEIAGVFVRRLEKRMRLQTDPTVIYGMGANYAGNITRNDLRTPTAYNTYTINGLPPTPIALAGREAIHAALHPKEGKALYFVARGDGTHYFSETLEEHNAAVARYQRRRKEGYRSQFKPEEGKQ